MLDHHLTQKIKDFVYTKPRTVQEIAELIKKNWRTADRYVTDIIQKDGALAIRTFREGTKGALKIVFWSNIEKIHSHDFQEHLYERIVRGTKKGDFSPFDIYQYIDKKKRNAFSEEQEVDSSNALNPDMIKLLKSASHQILIFSGNLSWANLKQSNENMVDTLEKLARKNIAIKLLADIDITTIDNAEKILSVNERVKKEMIEIRHWEHPLRAIIIDNKIVRFKEIKNPSDYEKDELKKKMFLFYEIYDGEWIEWIQKVFWNLYRTALPAKNRILDLKSIHKLV